MTEDDKIFFDFLVLQSTFHRLFYNFATADRLEAPVGV